MADKKITAEALAAYTPAPNTPPPTAAIQALATSDPVAVAKTFKNEKQLELEYNSVKYKNGKTIKMDPTGLIDGGMQSNSNIPLNCGFYLRNMEENETIAWTLKTKAGTELSLEPPLRISATTVQPYLGIKWPSSEAKLILTATSGTRKITLNLEKPDWYIGDLTVSEKSPTSRKTRTAKAGQILYLVQDNSMRITRSRIPTYTYKTNLNDQALKSYITHHNYKNNTSYTYETGQGPISHKISMNYDVVPATFGVNIKALGYDQTVKVQLVPFDKIEDESVIPGELLTNIRKLKAAISTVDKIKNKLDQAMGETASGRRESGFDFGIVANGQRYNEEDSDSRNYFSAKEYELKLAGAFFYKFSYGPTKFIPNALKEFIKVEIYVKPSLDIELIRSQKWIKLNGSGNETIDKKASGTKFQLVGGIALGATAKIDASKAFKFDIDASGKAEIEGSIGKTYANNWPIIVNAKPLVFNFSATVEIATIPVLQYNYIKNVTNEFNIYDSENK